MLRELIERLGRLLSLRPRIDGEALAEARFQADRGEPAFLDEEPDQAMAHARELVDVVRALSQGDDTRRTDDVRERREIAKTRVGIEAAVKRDPPAEPIGETLRGRRLRRRWSSEDAPVVPRQERDVTEGVSCCGRRCPPAVASYVEASGATLTIFTVKAYLGVRGRCSSAR